MRRTFWGGGLLLGMLALSACVTSVWQVSYSVGDNGHNSSGTLILSDHGVYIAGGTEGLPGQGRNSGVFLSRFDLDGQLQWDLVIPVRRFEAPRVAGGRVLAVDDEGSAYLAWLDVLEQRLTLYKVDATGQLVNQWPVLDGMFAAADDVKIGADGVVYVSARAGTILKAYSNEGYLLWAQEYPVPVVSGDMFLYQWQVSTLHVLADGNLLMANIDTLRLLSPGGVELHAITASDQGVDRFTRVTVSDERVWVVAVDAMRQGMLQGLSLGLQAESTQSLGSVDGHVYMDADSSRLCVVTGPDFTQGKSVDLEVHQVSPAGELLATTPLAVAAAGYWTMDGVVATDTGCYVAEYSGESGVFVNARVSYINSEGIVVDVVRRAGSTVEDFAVDGNDVYQVGVTGALDGSYTAVSLSKHHRY